MRCSSFTGRCVSREKRKTNRWWWKAPQTGFQQRKTAKILPPSESSHVLRSNVAGIKVACDLPAWPLILTVFWFEETRSCASLVFNLWDSVRAGQGVLWEGWSRPSSVYFGGQKAVSQQGACCHHCDLRTRAAGHHQDSREEGHSSMWDAQWRGQRAGLLLLNMSKDVKT